ncbi:MAG: hypothetical protein KF837_22605 [Labilithrix sp.]|nr:hypothetical protein [Labilithrix sp.]
MAVVAALLTIAGAARADTPPSVWDRAKSPTEAEEFELHEAVQRRLRGAGFGFDGEEENERIRALMRAEHARALAMLQAAGAEKSKNPLLRFDVAEAHQALRNFSRSAELYRSALAEFPNHPLADEAWRALAMACGYTGDHPCEIEAYDEVLRRETEDFQRGIPFLNLAESMMHQGDLRAAMDGYREALRIASLLPSNTTSPLATWGLAVALDRSGEHGAAEKEAKFALELELSLGFRTPMRNNVPLVRSRSVFFVPDYEVNWYLGLGEIAMARRLSSPRAALLHWQEADRAFGRWIEGAEKRREKDRWLPMAKARHARVKAEVVRAEAAVQKEPPAVHEDSASKTFHL